MSANFFKTILSKLFWHCWIMMTMIMMIVPMMMIMMMIMFTNFLRKSKILNSADIRTLPTHRSSRCLIGFPLSQRDDQSNPKLAVKMQISAIKSRICCGNQTKLNDAQNALSSFSFSPIHLVQSRLRLSLLEKIKAIAFLMHRLLGFFGNKILLHMIFRLTHLHSQ